MNNLKLILVRGMPGSGKSTLASSIAEDSTANGINIIWLETDMYWYEDGEYKFDIAHIKTAHEWCQNETKRTLSQGISVIVSNTFTQRWELQPYFNMAKEFGITPTVILAQNQFQNIHGVPDEVLTKMQARFEYDISELFED
jgi:predicted kinase